MAFLALSFMSLRSPVGSPTTQLIAKEKDQWTEMTDDWRGELTAWYIGCWMMRSRNAEIYLSASFSNLNRLIESCSLLIDGLKHDSPTVTTDQDPIVTPTNTI